jgi:hypothetical protein
VYEWESGATRPGSDHKPRHDILDVLEIPTGGQVPQKGDVGVDGLDLVPFIVLERELLWSPRSAKPTTTSRSLGRRC